MTKRIQEMRCFTADTLGDPEPGRPTLKLSVHGNTGKSWNLSMSLFFSFVVCKDSLISINGLIPKYCRKHISWMLHFFPFLPLIIRPLLCVKVSH